MNDGRSMGQKWPQEIWLVRHGQSSGNVARLDEATILEYDRSGDVPNCSVTSYRFDPTWASAESWCRFWSILSRHSKIPAHRSRCLNMCPLLRKRRRPPSVFSSLQSQ
jgi:hypothetical protein